MLCDQCGGEISAGSRFCPRCGRPAPGAEGPGVAGDRPPNPGGAPPPNPAVPPTNPGGLPATPPTMPPPPPPPPSYGAGAPPPSGGYGAPPPPPAPPPGYPPSGGYPSAPPGAFYGAPPGMGVGGGPVSYGLASLGQRLGGYLIDVVIVGAIFIFGLIVMAASTPASSFDDPNPSPNGVAILVFLLCALAAFVYYPFFEGRPAGQTLGKRALGIRVVRQSNGAPLGYGLAIWRTVVRIVDYLPFYLGLLWAIWDPQHQTFHDKIAGTLVVRSEVYPAPGATPAAAGYQQPAPPPSPYQTG